MKLSGIDGGREAWPIAMPRKNDNNPELEILQKQIDEKRKQLQEIGNEEGLSPEQKQKRRQAIEQEIADLEAQKNQAEMAAKQKEREEAEERLARHNEEAYSRNRDGDTAQISARGMKAMITAGQAIEMADVKSVFKNSLEDEDGIFESEIKQDKSSGVDTTKKEARLNEIQQRTNDLNRKSLDDLDEANEEMQSEKEEESA
ncbi:MAG: FlxA-like family protein [Lachnospiraceae bacterium]|nr:FlxA-like family protein [Lachnospiraceae bacterium]